MGTNPIHELIEVALDGLLADPDTPEGRLIAAVIFQAVVDVCRHDLAGITARDFLADPAVQDLAAGLWGVEVSPNMDARSAARAIEAYQRTCGRQKMHQRWAERC